MPNPCSLSPPPVLFYTFINLARISLCHSGHCSATPCLRSSPTCLPCKCYDLLHPITIWHWPTLTGRAQAKCRTGRRAGRQVGWVAAASMGHTPLPGQWPCRQGAYCMAAVDARMVPCSHAIAARKGDESMWLTRGKGSWNQSELKQGEARNQSIDRSCLPVASERGPCCHRQTGRPACTPACTDQPACHVHCHLVAASRLPRRHITPAPFRRQCCKAAQSSSLPQ